MKTIWHLMPEILVFYYLGGIFLAAWAHNEKMLTFIWATSMGSMVIMMLAGWISSRIHDYISRKKRNRNVIPFCPRPR